MFQLSAGPTCKRVTLFLITLFILAGLIACGGSSTKSGSQDSGTTPPPLVVSVSATCAQTSVPMGGTTTCTATVTNSTNQTVTWKVTEGDAAGTFANGTFTAAKVTADTTAHLVATSAADTTKTASVTLTIKAATIAASCDKTSLVVKGTAKCTATVTNAADTGVTFAITEANGGTFDATKGVYTAPDTIAANPTKFHLVATSKADTSKTASVELTVKNPIVITVAPKDNVTVHIKDSLPFVATVDGAMKDSTLTWAVKEGDNGGTIKVDDKGVATYTAPATVPSCKLDPKDTTHCVLTFNVVATSKEDSQFTATVPVKVYASLPVFTSVPCEGANPAKVMVCKNANQGDLWEYKFSATDTDGTTTISLNSAPEGGHIEANSNDTVAWIPTAEQSRKANMFRITAVSTSGASASQIWSVVPSGIVSGVIADKFVSALGVKTVPVDLSEATIQAIATNDDGSANTIDGVGEADGTFSIEKVPGGTYILTTGVRENVVTTLSTIDLTAAQLGRQDAKAAKVGTTRTMHFTNAKSWLIDGWDDTLYLAIPNVGETNWFYQNVPDAVTFDHVQSAVDCSVDETDDCPFYLASADAKVGDKAFVAQMRYGFSPSDYRVYTYLAKALALDITDVDGDDVEVTGALDDATLSSAVRPAINGTQFAALNELMSPKATTVRNYLYLGAAPFGLSNGYLGRGPELFNVDTWYWDAVIDNDVDLGSISYANPYPTTWPLYAEYAHITNTDYADGSLENGVYQVTDALPTLASPVVPILSPIKSATIGEVDFFEDQTGLTDLPTIAWEAPETGSVQGYEVRLYDMVNGGYTPYHTTDTKLTLPTGTVAPGTYVVGIIALTQHNADLSVTPFAKGFPQAAASATSGTLIIAAPEAPAVRPALKSNALQVKGSSAKYLVPAPHSVAPKVQK